MNTDFNAQYNTIVGALQRRNRLAIGQDGSLHEVGSLGYAWRVLTGMVTKSNAFLDTDAARVGNKIVDFVNRSKGQMTEEQGQVLIQELRSLSNRVSRKSYNIDLNIQSIRQTLGL